MHEICQHIELLYGFQPFPCDLLRAFRELDIPGDQHVRPRLMLSYAFQKGVALREDTVISQKLPVIGRACLGNLPVQEAPPSSGGSLHQKEVFGGEQHRIQISHQFPRAYGVTIQRDAAALFPVETKFKDIRHLPAFKAKRKASFRLFPPDEFPIGAGAVGMSHGGIENGFYKICLPLCVISKEDVDVMGKF